MAARRARLTPARGTARALAQLAALLGAVSSCDARAGDHGAGAPNARRADQHGGRSMAMGTAFEWAASNSAPRGCPMRLVAGTFLGGDGGSVYIPSRASLHDGWGAEVSADVLDEDRAPLPDSMDVLFFSHLEDRFYRGQFALPRERIAELFQAGYPSTREPEGRATYSALVVGVAPGGAVAVWASGDERQTEVFFGQAEPVDADWHAALDMPRDVDRRREVANTVAEAAQTDPLVPAMQARVPVGRWAAYRTRYRWQPSFAGLRAPDRLEPVQFVNGERDVLGVPFDGQAARAGLPAPRYLSFDEPSTGRSFELTFDEEEVTAAFARAAAGGGAVELAVAAEPKAPSGLRVAVRGAGGTVPLPRVRVEVFRP